MFQLADGMTVHVETVYMLLETKAGKKGEGGATWYVALFIGASEHFARSEIQHKSIRSFRTAAGIAFHPCLLVCMSWTLSSPLDENQLLFDSSEFWSS